MKLAITGINGRMGGEVGRYILTQENVSLSAAIGHGEGINGKDVGEILGLKPLSVAATHLDQSDFSDIDAVIDFTLPVALAPLLEKVVAANVPLVTGTTGLSGAEEALVKQAATKIPLLQSYNMSVGVNLLASLVQKTSAILDESFDIEIHEVHHRHKKDSPSGTALLLGRAAAAGRGVALDDKAAIDRDGVRRSGDIGFSVMRAGEVIGDHSVTFAGESDRIELTHRAQDRTIYAKGALAAARWLHDKPAGFYTMQDMLDLG